jgi:hypothetical protein
MAEQQPISVEVFCAHCDHSQPLACRIWGPRRNQRLAVSLGICFQAQQNGEKGQMTVRGFEKTELQK